MEASIKEYLQKYPTIFRVNLAQIIHCAAQAAVDESRSEVEQMMAVEILKIKMAEALPISDEFERDFLKPFNKVSKESDRADADRKDALERLEKVLGNFPNLYAYPMKIMSKIRDVSLVQVAEWNDLPPLIHEKKYHDQPDQVTDIFRRIGSFADDQIKAQLETKDIQDKYDDTPSAKDANDIRKAIIKARAILRGNVGGNTDDDSLSLELVRRLKIKEDPSNTNGAAESVIIFGLLLRQRAQQHAALPLVLPKLLADKLEVWELEKIRLEAIIEAQNQAPVPVMQ